MTQPRSATRTLPVLDVLDVAPPSAPAAPRSPALPMDARLVEYAPDLGTLPRFHVWTLGCQMNRSDSEEMAGRLLAAGCEEAPSMEAADLIVINTCAIREGAEQKVIGRQGHLGRLKDAHPGLRVVLTGCSVREPDRAGLRRRYPAVDVFLRPDEEPELVDRLGLASAQAPIGAAAEPAIPVHPVGATTMVGRTEVGVADGLSATRARAVGEGTVARSSMISAWLPIIYGCDKTCTYCIVPFSRGPERSRPFDDIVDEARALAVAGYREVTLLGQNVNSYGHDLTAEPRFAHVDAERWAGRQLDLHGRPDLAELIRAIDGLRTADGRPAIDRLRFVTSHPWDLSDRLIDALAECPSVCEHLHLPVQSGDDAVLRRMGRQYTIEHYEERLGRIRAAVPGITISTDIIVGFCGETEAQFASTMRLLEAVRYDQVFAAAYSPRPGTPATKLPDDVPADVKRRRLNELLALQEDIGLERNRAWLGRAVGVLVDRVTPPRAHDHEAPATDAPEHDGADHRDEARVSGRTRGNKLVHLPGGADLLGREVDGPHRPRRPVCAAWHARRSRQPRVSDAPPLIVVAGATATGKTAFAIELAEHLRATGQTAEIISADSRQVYRGLDIGTAKATAADQARVPHHGLDLVDPDEPFSVADFAAHARDVLTHVAAERGVAILAGGTGLYLRVVARGIDTAALPSDPELRARLEAQLIGEGLPALVMRLADIAPERTATIDLANPRRVVRALEIAELIGDGEPPPAAGYPGPVTWVGLRPSPAMHARRIAARAQAQFDGGLVDEARALRERYDPSLPAFSAIGYREAWSVIDGELTREQAIELDAQRNRQFAKRQATWFRSEGDITWLDGDDPAEPATLAAVIDRVAADPRRC